MNRFIHIDFINAKNKIQYMETHKNEIDFHLLAKYCLEQNLFAELDWLRNHDVNIK